MAFSFSENPRKEEQPLTTIITSTSIAPAADAITTKAAIATSSETHRVIPRTNILVTICLCLPSFCANPIQDIADDEEGSGEPSDTLRDRALREMVAQQMAGILAMHVRAPGRLRRLTEALVHLRRLR